MDKSSFSFERIKYPKINMTSFTFELTEEVSIPLSKSNKVNLLILFLNRVCEFKKTIILYRNRSIIDYILS